MSGTPTRRIAFAATCLVLALGAGLIVPWRANAPAADGSELSSTRRKADPLRVPPRSSRRPSRPPRAGPAGTPTRTVGVTVTVLPRTVSSNATLGFRLGQNYPNPFRRSTTIEYSLPRRSRIAVEVFTVAGQHVVTLVNTEQDAGRYSVHWEGTDDRGGLVPAGLYFYRLIAGNASRTRRLVIQ